MAYCIYIYICMFVNKMVFHQFAKKTCQEISSTKLLNSDMESKDSEGPFIDMMISFFDC